jgi:hypothetical protein
MDEVCSAPDAARSVFEKSPDDGLEAAGGKAPLPSPGLPSGLYLQEFIVFYGNTKRMKAQYQFTRSGFKKGAAKGGGRRVAPGGGWNAR